MRSAAMRGLALLLTGLCGGWGPAWAQGIDVQLAPSAAVACMTPPPAQRGEPEYPFDPWKRGEGGRVLVELIFTAPDRRPEVKVVKSEGDDALVDAVEKHVATLRVPCLQHADIPLRLSQDYVFLPDKRKVTWTVPVDTADAQKREHLSCRTSGDGSEAPHYPRAALRDGMAGNIFARLQFTAPDRPPTVTLYGGKLAKKYLATSAEDWLLKQRLPCMLRPVDAVIKLLYRLEGAPAFGFKNITFMQWLRNVKGLDGMQASFDTNEMGCPFELKIQYLQPHLPNWVGQFDAPDPRRRALTEWLATHELDLGTRQTESVFADTATFTIPCVKIDLKPKEKTS